MIDPDFWTDEKLGELSRDERLFFMGLISNSDDDGRGRANPKLLKSTIFPYDEDITGVDVKEMLCRLVDKKIILLYTVEGQDFYYLKNFSKHQSISKPQPSKIPAYSQKFDSFNKPKFQPDSLQELDNMESQMNEENNDFLEVIQECSGKNHEELQDVDENTLRIFPNHSENVPRLFRPKRKEEKLKEDKLKEEKEDSLQKPEFEIWDKEDLPEEDSSGGDENQTSQNFVPYKKIKDAYNAICIKMPKIRDIVGQRKRYVRALWKNNPSVEWFNELFNIASRSDFLAGKNDRAWFADFDWIINSTNAMKILEGKYENKDVSNLKNNSTGFKGVAQHEIFDKRNYSDEELEKHIVDVTSG
jgi:hypothetical protein